MPCTSRCPQLGVRYPSLRVNSMASLPPKTCIFSELSLDVESFTARIYSTELGSPVQKLTILHRPTGSWFRIAGWPAKGKLTHAGTTITTTSCCLVCVGSPPGRLGCSEKTLQRVLGCENSPEALPLALGSLRWPSWMIHSKESQDLRVEGGFWSGMESTLRSVSKSLAVGPLGTTGAGRDLPLGVAQGSRVSLPLALVVDTAGAKVSPCRDRQGL